MNYLRLILSAYGYCVVKEVREVINKDGKQTGNTAISFTYEGGSCSLVCPSNQLIGIKPQMVCEVQFMLEGCDCGFEYQGRHIPKDGFRIIGLSSIKPLDENKGQN